MKVIIVGAGLAGLTCAKVLHERGAEVIVFEASDGVGGRVRTDEKNGFLLDRGFQVYFTAYPAARRHLDHEKLNLKPFDPGAIVCQGRQKSVLSDPRRDPGAALPSLAADVATFGDKLRTLKLAASNVSGGAEAAGESKDGDSTTFEYLREQGFSERFIDDFFRPFYGGIFLDRTLGTSSRVFRFTFRMLATGETAVPAWGMGEIPRQLASHLPKDAVVLNSPVEDLLWEEGRVPGVRANGNEYEADAVVVATDAPSAGRLTNEGVPRAAVGQTCIYYATGGLNRENKILLNADDGGLLNNVVQISNVSRSYAPESQNLVCAVALGGMELPDEELYRRGVEEISEWYPNADLHPLAIYRIPFAQFAQPPGTHDRLPANRTATPGLILAGEYTEDSSINGSILSGEKAALEVLGS
ncbi:MAG: FAD-dependent oxidoreductase [Actinomycetota bacterium]|nr:FAD-dependent oxidoreductase [Actinomycetota bacterium]